MIIHRLRLHPFAGVADLTIPLEGGLNVILGPNEAGKSTVVNALRMALFTPTTYGKRQFDKEIKRFIPLSGGDTIQVDLRFAAIGSTYGLSKSWGSRCDSRLELPGGGLLADPVDVHEKLQELLVLKEGTYNSVLFAYQSGLGATLKSLSEDRTAAHDLAAILRKAVFETDGVPVEGLERAIRDEHEDFFSRWDADLRRPQGGRGVENPYKKGVGRILAAYYEKERLWRERDAALHYEKELDDLDERITALSDEAALLREFMESNRQAFKDARSRVVLEEQIKRVRKEEETLRDISKKWPVLQQKLKDLEENSETLKARRESLEKELAGAKEYEAARRKIEKYERAKKKRMELDEAKKALSEMKAIEEEDFRGLESLEKKLDRLKTSLKAGAITLSLIPEKPMKLGVAEDLEDERTCELTPGVALELSAGGQIALRHTDWALAVRSGEMDFEELISSFKKASSAHEVLLTRLQVSDFAECKRVRETYGKQQTAVRDLEGQLGVILERENYEELEALAASAPEEQLVRAAAVVAEELGKVKARAGELETDREEKVEGLEIWRRKYESPDALLELLVETRRESKDLEEKLKGLKPLPKGFEDDGSFINEFEGREARLREGDDKLAELRIERAEVEKGAPEETREELEVRLKEAERRFERVDREGDAIHEVLEAFGELRSSMDQQTLDPWIAEMQRVIAPLTADRYKRVALEEGEGPFALRCDGLEVPFDALSMGTKVGLALALRLSMARYFLEGLDGFLVLDDPLVDLDPQRQEAAVRLIRSFAGERQIVIVTCHPAHAELLGGNLIAVGGSSQT